MDSHLLLQITVLYTWTILISLTPIAAKLQGHPISRYVVEYDHSRSQSALTVFRHLVETQLKAHGIHFDDLRAYEEAPELFSGFSISIKNARSERALREASFVKALYPVLPVSRTVFLQTPRVLSTLQADKKFDLFEPHVQVGISRLHEAGFKCRGINIAVIDTGCDCNHPALGKGFGNGFKISKGYDFVGDAYNGTNKPKPDDNPCAACALHGTHIMGVLAADPNHMGFSGVCPEATMSSYRIFGCQEDTDDELVAAALLRAYSDGAEVFSLSVGAPGGWSGSSIAAVVASRIAQKRVVIVSAGNEGEEGMFLATSPSTGPGVFSVGSAQSTALVSYPFMTSATASQQFHYFATFAMKPGTFPVYLMSAIKNGREDACKPLSSRVFNLSQHIVLIRRSETQGCTFETQLKNLRKKGTQRIIWVNNNTFPEYVAPDSTNGVSVGVVTPEVGQMLRQQYFRRPGTFTITIPKDLPIAQVAAPDSGKVSRFSNYGPTFDLKSLQPAALAVGGNVLSTYPIPSGSYAIASGTSIAAPQMAGIAALIMSVQGKNISSNEVYSRLATSALPISNFSETNILESVCHQGTGLVNAWCAAMAKTIVSTYWFSLNDTLHFNGTQSVSITNKGALPISYTVDHVPAGTALAFSQEKIANRWPVPLISKAAEVFFSVRKFTLQPGQTQKVVVRFKPPRGFDQNQLPVYSGYVMLSSKKECESHTIAYFGVATPMKKMPVLDYGLSYQDNYTIPALDSGLTGLPVKEGHVFSLRGFDVPVIEYRSSFGSPLLLFDLVKGNTILPLTLFQNGNQHKRVQSGTGKNDIELESSNVAHNLSHSQPPLQHSRLIRRDYESGLALLDIGPHVDDFPGRLSNKFMGIELMGSIRPYDGLQRWNPRQTVTDGSSVIFKGEIFNLSDEHYQHAPAFKVPNGTYRILVRALRVTGDPASEEDFEFWLSPLFTIRRSNNKT